jgi:aspartyl aminopeptidase
MAEISDLLQFLDGSPSPAHAVASSIQRLIHGGFEHAELRSLETSFFEVEKGVISHRGAAIGRRAVTPIERALWSSVPTPTPPACG